MTRYALDGCREVFGRNVEPTGVVAHVALGAADTCREQCHKLLHYVGGAVSMRVGGVALGVSLEYVVHHCEAEAAHEFAIELQMTVLHTVAEAMEITEQLLHLLVCQTDDGVLVERDTASYAVVITWQLVLQKLIIGSKPLHLHIGMSSQTLHPGGCGDDHKIVLDYVVATFVEHETALPSRAEQMQAGLLELWGADAVKIGGVSKIGLHHTVICCEITHYFIYKQTISAKSEKHGAFCETRVRGKRRNFAVEIL